MRRVFLREHEVGRNYEQRLEKNQQIEQHAPLETALNDEVLYKKWSKHSAEAEKRLSKSYLSV